MQIPEHFRVAIEAAPVALMLVSQSGTIVMANSMAIDVFRAAELVGSAVDTLVPGHVREGHPALRARYADRPTKRAMGSGRKLQARRGDGELFPVEVGLNPVEFEGETFVLCSVLSLEAQEELDAQRTDALRQAMNAQKLDSLAKLAGGVAHDFNNLLAIILGNATYARSLAAKGGAVEECLAEIQEASEQARELAQQMLAYAGGQPLTVQRVDVGQTVADMLPLLQSLAGRDLRVTLVADVPRALCVRIDPTQLRQLLMNLTNNGAQAIDAGRKDGTLTLAIGQRAVDGAPQFPGGPALAPGRYVTIDVCDNGCGMDQALRRTIMEPFVSTKGVGRGLGLAVCQGILRAAGGGLSVYSEPGRGTTMQVLLPLVECAHDEASEPVPAAHLGTVLVVDDEHGVLRFVRRVLSAAGYEVLVAEGGERGVQVFHANAVDLVILDVTMPGMSGLDVLRALRKQDPDVRVLLSSGFSKEDATTRFAGRALSGFLHKPYSHTALLEAVRTALADL